MRQQQRPRVTTAPLPTKTTSKCCRTHDDQQETTGIRTEARSLERNRDSVAGAAAVVDDETYHEDAM
jgi:hypothetical protein